MAERLKIHVACSKQLEQCSVKIYIPRDQIILDSWTLQMEHVILNNTPDLKINMKYL